VSNQAKTNFTAAGIILCGFLMASVPEAHGQQKAIEAVPVARPTAPKNEDKDKSEDEKQREALIELVESETASELKRVYAATLRAELGLMADLFKLKESDVRKLGVAARGAASRSVERGRDSIMATVKRMMDRKLADEDANVTSVTFNGKTLSVTSADEDATAAVLPADEQPKGGDKEKLKITVAKRSSYFYFTVRHKTGSSSTTVGNRGAKFRDEDIWQKTIKSVLSADQLKEFDDFRTAKQKAAVVTMMLAVLQYELHLKDSQIPEVRSELDKQIGSLTVSTQNGIDSAVQQYRMKLNVEDFSKVLTEPQLDLWNSSQAYYKRYQ
jgi:hypothetical protein